MLQNNHNYLQIYDTSVAELASSPDSLVLKHRAVLSLARVGALDFAWAEYGRYGLGKVTQHNFSQHPGKKNGDKKLLEDIMALKGRLLKDMALRVSGDERTAYARRSVTAYGRAFAATGGFYSGINVAAMSVLGGCSERTVASKASDVLDLLPNEKARSQEDTYYIEATRAECLLLMGHKNKAGEILQDALMHDPLNYTAHATTFKQFGMILGARNESTEWLEPFAPPAAVHYAGHIFSGDPSAENYLDAQMQEGLREEICEQIQRHDIGFGYGALAAGSDILIAETLLEEGAELHVVLPAPIDQFIATSVTPFGSEWDARFDQCLNQVSSLRICGNTDSAWPDKTSAQYASQSAMGQAVMRANTLFGQVKQLLILAPEEEGCEAKSVTGADALTWRETGRKQIIIPYLGQRTANKTLPNSQTETLLALIYIELKALQIGGGHAFEQALETAKNCVLSPARAPEPILFKPTKTGILIGYERAGNAASCARDVRKSMAKQFPDKAINISGHYGAVRDPQNPSGDLVQSLHNISAATLSGEIYLSEPFAAVLAVFHATDFTVEYVGTSSFEQASTETRLFHLS